jgi:hypothetical protein
MPDLDLNSVRTRYMSDSCWVNLLDTESVWNVVNIAVKTRVLDRTLNRVVQTVLVFWAEFNQAKRKADSM